MPVTICQMSASRGSKRSVCSLPGGVPQTVAIGGVWSRLRAQGLFWLPYLKGERTPHLDALARGGWIGLTASHTRADLIRALIEGVSSQPARLPGPGRSARRGSEFGARFRRRRTRRFGVRRRADRNGGQPRIRERSGSLPRDDSGNGVGCAGWRCGVLCGGASSF
jgi:hypothetical protein